MPYPNRHGKFAFRSFFTATDELRYQREKGKVLPSPVPKSAILVFQPSVIEAIPTHEASQTVHYWFGTLRVITRDSLSVLVASDFGVGAPAAGIVMEFLIAMGVRRVVGIGMAGGLQQGTHVGHAVLCTGAVRDEGLSHHYLAPNKYVRTSPDLTRLLSKQLQAACIPFAEGTSWTCDAHYRETLPEVQGYLAEGVLTVEMEAAGLAAVALHHGIEFAAAFVVSDLLAVVFWQPDYRAGHVSSTLTTLFDTAFAMLANVP